MAEKTMAEILAIAKKAKAAIEGEQYATEGEYFDPSNLTLEQKLKLRKRQIIRMIQIIRFDYKLIKKNELLVKLRLIKRKLKV